MDMIFLFIHKVVSVFVHCACAMQALGRSIPDILEAKPIDDVGMFHGLTGGLYPPLSWLGHQICASGECRLVPSAVAADLWSDESYRTDDDSHPAVSDTYKLYDSSCASKRPHVQPLVHQAPVDMAERRHVEESPTQVAASAVVVQCTAPMSMDDMVHSRSHLRMDAPISKENVASNCALQLGTCSPPLTGCLSCAAASMSYQPEVRTRVRVS